jgi:hypothetical protein
MNSWSVWNASGPSVRIEAVVIFRESIAAA